MWGLNSQSSNHKMYSPTTKPPYRHTVLTSLSLYSLTLANFQPVVTAVPVKSPATTSVVVESSRFDMSQMKMEDFTSQRLQDDFDVSTAKQDDIASTSSSPTPSQKSPARSEGRTLIQDSILHFLTHMTQAPEMPTLTSRK